MEHINVNFLISKVTAKCLLKITIQIIMSQIWKKKSSKKSFRHSFYFGNSQTLKPVKLPVLTAKF